MPNENGRIPKDPEWCSDCIQDPRVTGDKTRGPGSPCANHRGPNGTKVPYAGYDAYEPSAWVLEVVGQQYRYHFGDGPRIYECFGYDPRHGFWMRTVDAGEKRQSNVSERAIGATFHRIRTDGSITRAQHMRASKKRALELLKNGDWIRARDSMLNDLRKHAETLPLIEMAGIVLSTCSDERSTREFITGFAE